MEMTVVIEPGLLTVTPENGLPVVINGQNVVTEGGVVSIRKQATLVTMSTPSGYVDVTQYKVILDLTNLRQEVIWMGSVTDHADWTNDEAGTELAIEEIKEALTSGGGGGGGTVTSASVVTANGFSGSVATADTTPAITLSTTVSDTQVVVANGGDLTGSVDFTYDGTTLNVAQAVQVDGDVLGDALIINQDGNETFSIGPGGEVRVDSDPGAVDGILTSAGPGVPPTWSTTVYAETAALNAPAIHGSSTNGGEGVRGESTTGSGVEGIVTTGVGLRGTNASTTNPTIHTNNTDATNVGPLAWFHNDVNDGLEVQNDGSLLFTAATGAPNTALSLQPAVVPEPTASHDIVLVDLNTIISTESASATALEIQTQANVAYPDGFVFYVLQTGAGQATVTGDVGVTVVSSRSAATYAQYSLIGVRRLASNSWLAFGDTE